MRRTEKVALNVTALTPHKSKNSVTFLTVASANNVLFNYTHYAGFSVEPGKYGRLNFICSGPEISQDLPNKNVTTWTKQDILLKT